jgi:hypothetical protein
MVSNCFIFSNAYSGGSAISITQLFNDGVNRTGNSVIVSGNIIRMHIVDDPFSDIEYIKVIDIGSPSKEKISIILREKTPESELSIGDTISIKFALNTIVGSFANGSNGVIFNDIQKIRQYSQGVILPNGDIISVERYFEKNTRLGRKLIKLEGVVRTFEKSGYDVRIDIGTNKVVQAYLSKRIWSKENIKAILKSLKSFDKIIIEGSFDMEGPIYIFTALNIKIIE